jgi:hypothetical protein
MSNDFLLSRQKIYLHLLIIMKKQDDITLTAMQDLLGGGRGKVQGLSVVKM